ncbi:MAG: HAD family phosphatase [Clostridia bacterium]|nr:HAD family phosphatase [Clostridia bacterium]
MIKGIIFDADGTLLDSMHIWEELGERYLADRNIIAEEGLGKTLYPMTLEQSSTYLKNKYSIKDSTEKIINDILSLLTDFYKKEVLLKEGVGVFLEKMKSKGVAMGIATSGDKELLVSALKRLNVYHCFSVILTCSQYDTSKNEPLIYLKTAQMLGTTANETVVFEDVLYGIKTAKDAGFVTVAVEDLSNIEDRQQLKECADYYIRDFNDKVLENI